MSGDPTAVTEALLRGMPLPRHQDGEDKEQRGRVLVVAGSREVPGAALLVAEAALRAGAGKVQIAAGRSTAPHIAVAMPEARVFALAEAPGGDLAAQEGAALARRAGQARAVVIGPGMLEGEEVGRLTLGILREAAPGSAAFLLDAAALHRLGEGGEALRPHAGRLVVTPHAGEMATLLGTERDRVLAAPLEAAREAAARLQAVVVMKGGCSFIVSPQGRAWSCDRGNVGLATAGSGDTLAGIIAGLLARGAPPLEATLWGVFLHGEAGARLARAQGGIGFLARELAREVPAIMGALAGPG